MALHHRVIAAATGSQSHLIVAAILLSFIVWATLQGHLGRYLNDLGIGKKPVPPSLGGAAGAAGAVGGATVGGGAGVALGQAINSLPGLPSVQIPPLPGQPGT